MASLVAALVLILVAAGCAPDDPPTGAVDPFDNNAAPAGDEASPQDGQAPGVEPGRQATPEEAPPATDATASSSPAADAELEPPWSGQPFELQTVARTSTVTGFTTRPGSDDLWLAEREGRVRVVQRRLSPDGDDETVRLLDTVALDISDKVTTDGEGGLLGLDFSTGGDHLYVSYTDNGGDSVVAEYRMDSLQAVADSERVVLQVPQPFANHNGGQITVGPDGFLYIALGDGGGGGDPEANGQDTGTLLGSILRIDPSEPSDGRGYAVPADNPFVDRSDARPEIWLYGVRNPWRFSFDHDTGDLWIGDVGQNEIEEINLLPNDGVRPAGHGANLGWNIMEGDQLFQGEAPPADHVGPVFTYGHDFGRCSVTGGYVYRGDRNESLDGAYLFADFCSGEIIGLKILDDGRVTVSPVEFDREVGRVVGFGQGPERELYVLEADGAVSRIQHTGWDREIEIVEGDEATTGG